MKPALLIGAVGVALVAFLGYHTVYVPKHAQAQVIQAQIADEGARQQAQQEVAMLLTQVERYRKRLPPEPDPSWLVREAVALGQRAEVQLTTIQPEAPVQFQQLTRLAVSLQFTATYHELGTFLDSLESSEIFLRVERLHVSRSQEAAGRSTIQTVLSTFYLPDGDRQDPR